MNLNYEKKNTQYINEINKYKSELKKLKNELNEKNSIIDELKEKNNNNNVYNDKNVDSINSNDKNNNSINNFEDNNNFDYNDNYINENNDLYINEDINKYNNSILNNESKLDEYFAIQAVEQQILDEICPNPDSMTYEQLLKMEENMGNVNKGLSKEKIKKLPIILFKKNIFKDEDKCVICQEDYIENEKILKLTCGHIFHNNCIENWLIKEKKCPFCKEEIIV